MEQATLGKTGLRVSRLGAGLAEIGSLADAAVAGRLLNAALDGGVTFLDTAACYGRSEEWIGRTIGHRRGEYVLATKAGHLVKEEKEEGQESTHEGRAWTAPTIRDSIERSLRRMRTDYLDLVQLHSCDAEVLEAGEVVRALLDAKQAGKTRFVGYSGPRDPALWAIESGLFDTLQVTFNLVDQWMLRDVIPQARARGMGIIAKRPIANAAWGARPSDDPVREWYRGRAQAMLEAGPIPIPGAPEDPILLALGFVLAHEEVDTAIVGTRNPAHMEANIRAVEEALPLPVGVVGELRRRFERLD